MNRALLSIAFLVALPVAGKDVLAQEPAKQPAATDDSKVLVFKPFDQPKFEKHMQALGVTERQIASFRKNVEDESSKHAVDDLLMSTFKDYRDAVALAEKADPRAAIELTKVIEGNKDPYVNAYARFQLSRFFLNSDDPEQASAILSEFVDKNLNVSPLDSEVIYFYGSALAMIPEREQAVNFFAAFLREFPNAPERLRSSAAQIKAELEQQEGMLHDISDIMRFCERKIRKTSTGQKTQDKQKMIIEELQKIIEMMEKQEQSGGGAPGGPGGLKPAENSALPGGNGATGSLKKAPRKVAEKWGALRPGERKAIEAELNGKMSPRYRKMLEDYYKKLGKTGRNR
jgi:tetratricopeptide (TPR) repeat protein